MDGFETASLIRKRPATEHTPIIFVTSMNQSENHIARGYQLGAVDYILTPIIPQVLRSKVRSSSSSFAARRRSNGKASVCVSWKKPPSRDG